ncbi:MAG: preprotein translocase subunit SecG [Clostridiales bacterium]|nr:preprotein translocase subunit SecG [Clostridiales bacterium]MCF8021623.1 preprotein translocase subunit SecG [Clostridiales bacterium]
MLEIALIILHVIVAVALITIILLQSGKSAGLSGSITGGAETLLGKKKGLDELLGKITVVLGLILGILSLVLTIIMQ